MTIVLILLVLVAPPRVELTRHQSWEECQAEAMRMADFHLRQRQRVWFRCVDLNEAEK